MTTVALTAHFGISTGTPSQHYTDEEAARMDARDYDVTVTIGSVVIEGGITLYRDDGNGGRQGTCGTPRDGWCSDSILKGIARLTEQSQREILGVLGNGEGSNGDEIDLSSEPTPEDHGAEDAVCVVTDAGINAEDFSPAEHAADILRSIHNGGSPADEALINALGWPGVYELAWIADEGDEGAHGKACAWCERYNVGYVDQLREIAVAPWRIASLSALESALWRLRGEFNEGSPGDAGTPAETLSAAVIESFASFLSCVVSDGRFDVDTLNGLSISIERDLTIIAKE